MANNEATVTSVAHALESLSETAPLAGNDVDTKDFVLVNVKGGPHPATVPLRDCRADSRVRVLPTGEMDVQGVALSPESKRIMAFAQGILGRAVVAGTEISLRVTSASNVQGGARVRFGGAELPLHQKLFDSKPENERAGVEWLIRARSVPVSETRRLFQVKRCAFKRVTVLSFFVLDLAPKDATPLTTQERNLDLMLGAIREKARRDPETYAAMVDGLRRLLATAESDIAQ